MKVTDYIIAFLESKGIYDIFGYPGAVVCHLMDSASKSKVRAHENYHEQAAAFAACGYAQASGRPGVAYANVGPGATNLTTGVANAWFDSIPVIFITGQVDIAAMKGEYKIRQRGIQELHAAELFSGITKYAVSVMDKEDIVYCLERAFYEAVTGRPGPVLLEIPADIQRADIETENQRHFVPVKELSRHDAGEAADRILRAVAQAKRPCILIGNGVRQSNTGKELLRMMEVIRIPYVFSLPAHDLLPFDHPLNMGYIGMNARRYSNFVLGKSDLIISLGSRMDLKQVGTRRERFASSAQLIRVDTDRNELEYQVREDETDICAGLHELLSEITDRAAGRTVEREEWLDVCHAIRDVLYEEDLDENHRFLRMLGRRMCGECVVTVDVGHHLVYSVQAMELREGQRMLLSTGLGSMGYSLPAAIGAYYGSGLPVYVICGDGGFQMNMQELQFIKRDNLPIKVIVMNNHSLGMIKEFQERNFQSNFIHTVADRGYTVPDFSRIAAAYGLDYDCVEAGGLPQRLELCDGRPAIIEVNVRRDMYLKLRMNKEREIQDMDPELDRELYRKIMEW